MTPIDAYTFTQEGIPDGEKSQYHYRECSLCHVRAKEFHGGHDLSLASEITTNLYRPSSDGSKHQKACACGAACWNAPEEDHNFPHSGWSLLTEDMELHYNTCTAPGCAYVLTQPHDHVRIMELDNQKEYFHCFTCNSDFTRQHRKRYINRGGSLEPNTQPLPPEAMEISAELHEDNQEETAEGILDVPEALPELGMPEEAPTAPPEQESEQGLPAPGMEAAAAPAYGQHQVTCENAGCTLDYLEDHTIRYHTITDLYTTKHRVICQQDCGLDVTEAHKALSFSPPTEQGHTAQCGSCQASWSGAHTYGAAYQLPEAPGSHYRNCTVCGYTRTEGHDWTITKTATTHTRSCAACGASTTENHTGAFSYDSATQHQQTCTVCGQVTKANHTITSTRPLTEAGQEGYHENYCATCGGRWNEAHTYGSYTDSSASVHVRTCTKCGKENYQAHSWGSYSSTGSTQHKRTCTVSTCGRTQTSNHSWSGYSYLSATYHKRTCSACAASQNASHSISSVTSVDGTNHQNYCATCNGYWNVAHTLTVLTPYGNATKHLAGCTKCNYNIGQNHTFDAWVNYSSSEHRHQCTGCKEYHTASHGSYGSWASYSSSQHRRKCGSCSYYQYSNHGSYGAWANYSDSQHRRKCGSCAYYQYGNHSYGSNSYYSSTQHRKKCTSCPRYVYANHSYQYSGGYLRCSGCGHEKPYA